MFDEDFKIDKSNVLMLLITLGILIVLIIVSLILINSLSKPVEDLPDLEVTKGRTSTLSSRTKSTTTTTTTKVTTTRAPGSPYYDIDVDSLLQEEILTKEKILRKDAEEIIGILYEFANRFYNLSDNSLIDVEYTINNVLLNDNDVIVIDGNRYGIIYDYEKLIDKLIASDRQYVLNHISYNNIDVFVKQDGNTYRLENKIGDVYPILASLSVDKFSSTEIHGFVRYYMSDYAEQGHTSPVYKQTKFNLKFEDGRWKISEYIYPAFEG